MRGSFRSRAAEDPDELEEERRLAYVITRAEKILYLTNANSLGRTNYVVNSFYQ